eukprot:GHVT01048309.1.p4 GENE.GHVT01048309.1~~GHVT01048309.1.p4  ORF type:complete len:162 (-),score=28.57 GHVT01048309.1:4583-5068(-)
MSVSDGETNDNENASAVSLAWKQDALTHPRVGALETLATSLLPQFETHPVFYPKIQRLIATLSSHSASSSSGVPPVPQEAATSPGRSIEFSAGDSLDGLSSPTVPCMRRVRKDGSCFYRALMFLLLERLVNNKTEIPGMLEKLKELHQQLKDTGYASKIKL